MQAGPILIVDDEPSNLALLEQILGDQYTLAFARNGAEGLAAARKHRPILILLDVQMPDMDGYAVCRSLKSDPLTEDTPVIFVSSMSEVGDEAAGFACGAVDYIIKPVSAALVHARVRNQLSLVRAAKLEHYVRELELEQAKTARLSRIHAVLSGTNSAIVRIRQPLALLQEACRIAVAHGGFGHAWIGLADAAQAITLSASVDGAAAATGLPPPARDIVAHVLHHGAAAVCDDGKVPADCGANCADARARGYHSVLGLPLHASGGVIGVMLLYARSAGSFDDEERKLLAELAGDIAFALESIENEKRANFLSYYDALTGVPNTTLFLDRLEQLVNGARHEAGGAFVIALNLERFKQVNDGVGRHGGDQALRTVASRLSQELCRPCTVARIGADNFALAGELAPGDDLATLCEQVIELVSAPITIGEQAVQLAPRLGVAVFPADGGDAEALLRNAEAAQKQCKAALARFLYFSQELNARMAEKLELEQMLKRAIQEGQFVLYYQPKVDLRTGAIAGAEALIRWQHPERGMVPPDRFIPLAEETGLIVPIGDWVIRAVCAQQSAWLRAGGPVVPVALNLSALQFRQGNVLATLRSVLEEHALDPACVELELTESVVMQDPAIAQQTMLAFGALGLKLSLDDFGTGYSSLAYLKRFPFQYVKIDRAFITDVTNNPDDAAISMAIIAMAHSLRMRVIAEGVETAAQLQFLRARDCDYIQGYYFSRPVAAPAFHAMLAGGQCLDLGVCGAGPAPTILVVDEATELRDSVHRALGNEGYRILQARSASEALTVLATESVQVVLSDRMVHKRDGRPLISIVARLYPDTIRIVLSGYAELQAALDALNRGEVYRFLTKPWDDQLLKHTVVDALRRHQSG